MNEKGGVEKFPLSWPDGWPRTKYREASRFRCGFGQAVNEVFAEIKRLGGGKITASSNIPLKNDGMPRANQPNPSDPGVAVYFRWKEKDMVFACDKHPSVKENFWAIAKTIAAMRGIKRWGASDMMERAFAGFARLPEKAVETWRESLDFQPHEQVSLDIVEARFRSLVRAYHESGSSPDRERFEAIVEARNQARRELSV